jgi:hypothetical protein
MVSLLLWKLIGTAHTSPLAASQFPVDSVLRDNVTAVFVWYEMKGGRKVWFTSLRSSSPAYDHRWLASAPKVQGPAYLRITNVGPAAHFSVPRKGSLETGSRSAGPMPQIATRGWAGDKNAEKRMSLMPKVASPPGISAGTITRAMWFTFSVVERLVQVAV